MTPGPRGWLAACTVGRLPVDVPIGYPLASFWLGGYEGSTHLRRAGGRHDLIAATRHDALAAADYARLRQQGIGAARDGLRWPLIERSPGRYDFASFLPMLRAARGAGVQVIWDLCHYGWPEDLDIWRPAFVDRFARYAREAARVVADETGEVPIYVPINEISFWAWAGGEVGFFNPFARRRGPRLKAQLVRATLAAIDAIRAVDPRARFLQPEPLIHVMADPARPQDAAAAAAKSESQFETWEMLAGRLSPEFGGAEGALDLFGVNFYPHNEWIHHDGRKVLRGAPLYRPLSALLADVHRRYGRPLLIAETGAEGDERVPWLAYVGEEVRAARGAGVPVTGICLYPVLDYPGWDDGRHCPCGLWGFADSAGDRPLDAPFAAELARQRALFAAADAAVT